MRPKAKWEWTVEGGWVGHVGQWGLRRSLDVWWGREHSSKFCQGWSLKVHRSCHRMEAIMEGRYGGEEPAIWKASALSCGWWASVGGIQTTQPVINPAIPPWPKYEMDIVMFIILKADLYQTFGMLLNPVLLLKLLRLDANGQVPWTQICRDYNNTSNMWVLVSALHMPSHFVLPLTQRQRWCCSHLTDEDTGSEVSDSYSKW